MTLCKPVHTAGISMASLWNSWNRMTVVCVETIKRTTALIIYIMTLAISVLPPPAKNLCFPRMALIYMIDMSPTPRVQ